MIRKRIKSLITGGAGFIGSHLAEELIKRNHQIIIIDNLFSGKLNNLSNLKKIINSLKQIYQKQVNGKIILKKLIMFFI